jgi:minor extracellular serine protease Vpr
LRRFTRLATAVIAAVAAVPLLAAAAAQTGGGNNQYVSDGPTASTAGMDTNYAIVVLNGPAVADNPSIAAGHGHRINLNSPAVQSYRSQLASERNTYRQWLNANYPAANVTGQFDIALNAIGVQLNGTSVSALTGGPNAVSAQYQGLYHPTRDKSSTSGGVDPDLTDINAFNAWAENHNVPANAGAGIKIGDIDTGIDLTNPCFNDAGYSLPAGWSSTLGDPRFTNNKVIVARVFNEKTPAAGYTPQALQDHGTHTAGTLACDAGTTAWVNGLQITQHTISGVAPHAWLGNYNVFPGSVLNVRDEELFAALESAYSDGMDIINMSIGGGFPGSQDVVTHVVDSLDNAGMLSAIAAGNDGPGFGTVESPGMAADALTAGASTVGHVVASPVTVGSTTVPGVRGDFGTLTSNLTAPLAVVTGTGADGLDLACGSVSGVTGKIALIARGGCTFSTKVRNLQTAGAVGALVVNNVGGDPIAMGQDGTANQPTIPAYGISMTDGTKLTGLNGSSATISTAQQYFVTGNDDIMASFSSQGPTPVTYRVKPDVVAPGVNVLSSVLSSDCDGGTVHGCFAFFQGTSMATPHLAGSAAVVEWEHPDWTPAQVRSAIVNTAARNLLTQYNHTTTLQTNPLIEGAGLENLDNAVKAQVALDPVSVSFGTVPSISGQTQSAPVTLSNLSGASETLALSAGSDYAQPKSGVSFSVSPASVTLAPGGSATVTVTLTEAKGAATGNHYAWLEVNSGSTNVAHAALYTDVTT